MLKRKEISQLFVTNYEHNDCISKFAFESTTLLAFVFAVTSKLAGFYFVADFAALIYLFVFL